MAEVIQTAGYFTSQKLRLQAKIDLKLHQRPGQNTDPVITTATGKDTIVVPTVNTKPTP